MQVDGIAIRKCFNTFSEFLNEKDNYYDKVSNTVLTPERSFKLKAEGPNFERLLS